MEEQFDFFRPKNLNSRIEKRKRERREIVLNLKKTLEQISLDYKNENWESEPERLFLEIFDNLKFSVSNEDFSFFYFSKKEILVPSSNVLTISFVRKLAFLSRSEILKPFRTIFFWKEKEIIKFFREQIEKHFADNISSEREWKIIAVLI
jgi:hypothetical protein